MLAPNDLVKDISISIDNDQEMNDLIRLDDSIQANNKRNHDENPQNLSLLGSTSPSPTVSTIRETEEQRKVLSSSSLTIFSLDFSPTVDKAMAEPRHPLI